MDPNKYDETIGSQKPVERKGIDNMAININLTSDTKQQINDEFEAIIADQDKKKKGIKCLFN